MKVEQLETNSSSRPAEDEPNSTAAEQPCLEQPPHAPKRNSKRGTTRIKKESGAIASGGVADKDEEGAAGENIKRRRTWELWSASDKHIFFDVLNEYGKDFDSIHQHFQAKFKTTRGNSKAPLPAHYIKNKNQIRHFYYRTWHKIAPHIQFGPHLKKTTRELYGLVNYGELWKKMGGTLGVKVGIKLNELVQKGSTTLKIKGKTVRVRTPVCRALKELHSRAAAGGSADSVTSGALRGLGPPKLPNKVVISLRPRHTADWVRVQKIAQNPHVRMTVGIQRRVISLLRCLTAKWRQPEAKTAASLGIPEEKLPPTSGGPEEQLVLLPRKGATINIPVISADPVLTSSDIGLQNMPPDDEPVAAAIQPEVAAIGGSAGGGDGPELKKPRIRLKFKFVDPRDGESGSTIPDDGGVGQDNNNAFSSLFRQLPRPLKGSDMFTEEEEDIAFPLSQNDPNGTASEGRVTPKSRKRKLAEPLPPQDFVLTEDSEAESSRSPGGPQTDLGSDRESDAEPAAGPSSFGGCNGAALKKEEEEDEGEMVKQEGGSSGLTVQQQAGLAKKNHPKNHIKNH
jgi:hypothetical protein